MAHYGGASLVSYENAEGATIDFSYVSVWGSIAVSNKNTTYSTLEKDDITYHIFAAETDAVDSGIVWDKGNLRFSIQSALGMDEIMTMAFSAQKK